MFTRAQQISGGMLAALIYGTCLGVVFGFACAVLWPRLPGATAFSRSIRLAVVAFVAWVLVPNLKYPANPPAVGDPDTVGQRTASYLGLMAVSLILAYLAWELWDRLSDRGLDGAERFAAVGGAYMAAVTIAWLVFPANPDAIEVPANLIWHFRIQSLGGNAILWVVTGTAFGYLADRVTAAVTRRRMAAPTVGGPLTDTRGDPAAGTPRRRRPPCSRRGWAGTSETSSTCRSASTRPRRTSPRSSATRCTCSAGIRTPTAAAASLAAAMDVDEDLVVLTNGGAEGGRPRRPARAGRLGRRSGVLAVPPAPHRGATRRARWRSNPSNPLGRLADADATARVWDEAFYPLATGQWSRRRHRCMAGRVADQAVGLPRVAHRVRHRARR